MGDKANIVITGAAGLLGNRAVKQFCDTHNVYAIVRCVPDEKVDGVNYIELDLSSQWDDCVLPKTVDTIFHLAQSSKFRDFPDEAMDVFNVNVRSTAKLLDYAHKVGAKRFVYASSGGIYGTGAQAFDEDSPITPSGKLGYYLGSKLCSEVLVQNYAGYFDVVTLRFFFMYGPEQGQNMLIPRLVDSVRSKKPITLQGNDGIRINPIHVKDACLALKATLSLEESCTINIAGPDILTLRDIANIIGDVIGEAPVFEMQDSPANHIVANIKGMSDKLHAPETSFSKGVLDFIEK